MGAQTGDKIYAERLGIPGTVVVEDILKLSSVRIFHGANASEIRPEYMYVDWFGSVVPLNMLDGDTFSQTT